MFKTKERLTKGKGWEFPFTVVKNECKERRTERQRENENEVKCFCVVATKGLRFLR